MSFNKSVVLFGYSGHAYVIIESLLEAGFKITGYFESKENINNPYNLNYLGSELNNDIKDIVKKQFVFPCVGDNYIRSKIIGYFKKMNFNQFCLIDPTANLSKNIKIGNSTYVGKGAIVNAQSFIGEGVILNTGSITEHECYIGDFSHLGPASVLCGNVRIGEYCFLGANSIVKQNINVVSETIIGAGSVIIKPINIKGVYVGSPARLIK